MSARLGALLMCVVACSSESAPAAKPTLSGANQSCSECAGDACAAEVTACEDDSSCRAYHACLGACHDSDCRVQCRDSHRTGFSVTSAKLDSCLAARCEAKCEIVCGGYIASPKTCAACTERSCCDVSAACMKDPACASLLACRRTCAALDGLCFGECDRRFPGALTKAYAFTSCIDRDCAAPHQEGKPSSCIPSELQCLVSPQPPGVSVSPTTAEIYFHINKFNTGPRPEVVGAKVRACGIGEAGCSVSEETTSDANGLVHVHLPMGDFNGFYRVSHPDLMPAIVFFDPTHGDAYQGVIRLVPTALVPLLVYEGTPDDMLIPGRGHVLVDARDCLLNAVSGVAGKLVPESGSRAYVRGGPLARDAEATDAFGVIGFLNVAPPNVTVVATLLDFGIEYPRKTVLVEDGTLTYVRMNALKR